MNSMNFLGSQRCSIGVSKEKACGTYPSAQRPITGFGELCLRGWRGNNAFQCSIGQTKGCHGYVNTILERPSILRI